VVGFTDQDLDPSRFPPIRLRKTTQDDLPELFEMQLDPESNAMAVTNPRSAEAFAAHWDNVFQGARRLLSFGALSFHWLLDPSRFLGPGHRNSGAAATVA